MPSFIARLLAGTESHTQAPRPLPCIKAHPTTPCIFPLMTPPASLFERLGGRPALMHLLRYFYADVRQHAEIGPLFAAQITDWPAHLEKIGDFWSGLTGGPQSYSGPMPFKHVHLGLAEKHFQAWLGLWRRHCQAHLAPTEAEDMILLAEGIGQRLRQILTMHGAFGN
jgi:hemoglobin